MTKISEMTRGTYEAEFSKLDGEKALIAAAYAVERLHLQLQSFLSDYRDSKAPAEQARILSWSINAIACNLMPNARLDLLAGAQARLNVAAEIIRAEKQA